MAEGQADLRTLLDSDRQLVLEILDTAHKLVVDVGGHYYWTHHALEVCGRLSHIGQNLAKLLDLCGTYWNQGPRAFGHPEPVKLWTLAVGLFRALQPERAKFQEQLAKRRRQRIMGQGTVDETDLTDPAVAAADKERFKEQYALLVAQWAGLNERIRELPSGLLPPEDSELPPLNGKGDEVPGAVHSSPAQAAPPPPELGGSGD